MIAGQGILPIVISRVAGIKNVLAANTVQAIKNTFLTEWRQSDRYPQATGATQDVTLLAARI